MEIPYSPELGETRFSETLKSQQLQQVPPISPQNPEIQENKNIQLPPKVEENKEETLIGIFLKKEKNSIDYAYNSDFLDLILYNKNIIVGMLEQIKLDVLTGEKPENE